MQKVYLLQTDILNNEKVFIREYAKMPEYRKEKINRLRFQKDKNLSLGAGILLRKGLSERGIDVVRAKIQTNDYGKPYLADSNEIFFSLSHSGSYAMASFADVENGCDIERIKECDMKIARRFYSPVEVEILEAEKDENKRQELFYRFWTLKESYMKLTGQGMALALNSFSVYLNEPVTVEVNNEKQNAQFFEFAIDHYRAAVSGIKSGQQDMKPPFVVETITKENL